MKHYKNSNNKCKKELKALKNQKMRYSIAKESGSRREMENIKKIKAKASKKVLDNSSNSFSKT